MMKRQLGLCSPTPEGVYDHLPLHRLDGVHHHSHCSLIQCLEALRIKMNAIQTIGGVCMHTDVISHAPYQHYGMCLQLKRSQACVCAQ